MLARSLIILTLLSWGTAAAQTEALLAELIAQSPELAAAKAEAEARRAEVWAARGQALPQLRVEAQTGSVDETFTVEGFPGELSATRDPSSAAATVEQVLFTSGRVGGAIGAAKAQAQQAETVSEATRQDVILNGASAIAAVVRDRAILDERRTNEHVVASRLRESEARRSAGLATNTDVRQSEARLALASAERIEAEARLSQSEAAFLRLFGFEAPDRLAMPRPGLALPADLQVAIDRATRSNPDLVAAQYGRVAAREAVRSERGRILPQVSVNASAGYADEQRFGIELGEAEQYAVTLNGRWEIFNGGSGHAMTRAAKRRETAARQQLVAAERRVREQTIRAWTNVLAGCSVLEAREAQAEAAALAAEGVAAEFRNGRRTRLDVLDADRERTEADVAVVTARTQLAVAEFELLRAMGSL